MYVLLPTVDSTNTYAKQHVSEFLPGALTCITAEEQTAGRGRFLKTWYSPPGVNLYLTFYFSLPVKTPHILCLSHLLAVTGATLLAKQGLRPQIKWPNDLQLSGKKVGGVLCETEFQPDRLDVFLGLGLNVNLELEEWGRQIDQPATSLKQETGRAWNREQLRQELTEELALSLGVFMARGFAPFRASFEHFLSYHGKRVQCTEGEAQWVGVYEAVTDEGLLQVKGEDGRVSSIMNGRVME